MPGLSIRKPTEVPQPRHVSRAAQEQQELYEGFIKQLDGNIGELQLSPNETLRGIKVRLSRAATRLGTTIEVWDANGMVYFKAAERLGKRRPRKAR